MKPRKKKILLVEDEKGARVLFQNAFRHNNYTVISTNNGQDAIEIYKKNPVEFDLVFMDITMPKLGGEEAQEIMHQINPNIKTILTSGLYANKKDEVLFRKRHKGVVDFIPKPTNNKNTVYAINRAINLKHNRSSGLIQEFINRIDQFKKLNEKESQYIFNEIEHRIDNISNNLDLIVLSDKGYTNITGFQFKDKFIKIDLEERLKQEYKVYSLNLGEFSIFQPEANLSSYVADEKLNIAILSMENLNLTASGIEKANYIKNKNIPKFTKYGLGYNLYLMSLFHKEATKYVDQFEQVIYTGANKQSHFEEGNIPLKNTKDKGYQLFKETKINSTKAKQIIQTYRKLQNTLGNTIIHGDWKEDNLVKGHLVDYAMTGIGFEIDEIAYYISDAKFNMNITDFHKIIEEYVLLRSTHDEEFAKQIDNGYRKTMHQLAAPSFLTQLVLRHSVMNKRDLNDPEKFKQRQYYQHQINQILKEERFV